jgi:outer membrane immunogenic protein
MRKLPLAAAALVALALPAKAADMPMLYKAPVPVPTVYGWTGWYVGANLGGVWSNDPVALGTSNAAFCPAPGCTAALATSLIAAQGSGGSFGGNKTGLIGGGQFGYNWQLATTWVAGFETDFQGISGASSSVNGGASTIGLPGFPGSSVTTNGIAVTKEIDSLGTVRGRLGYLFTPSVLLYGTGGLAYGEAKSSTSVSQSPTQNFVKDCRAFAA